MKHANTYNVLKHTSTYKYTSKLFKALRTQYISSDDVLKDR